MKSITVIITFALCLLGSPQQTNTQLVAFMPKTAEQKMQAKITAGIAGSTVLLRAIKILTEDAGTYKRPKNLTKTYERSTNLTDMLSGQATPNQLLMDAVCTGCTIDVHHAIKAGADVNACVVTKHSQQLLRERQTALRKMYKHRNIFMVASSKIDPARPLVNAVRLGKVEMIQLLLDNGAHIDILSPYEMGGNALHNAVGWGQQKAVAALLCAGANSELPIAHDSYKAITIAVKFQHSDIIQTLLRHNADTLPKTDFDRFKITEEQQQILTQAERIVNEEKAALKLTSPDSNTSLADSLIGYVLSYFVF